MRQLVRERFVVTMKSGDTFSGLLDNVDATTLEFVDASALAERGPVKVDGRLYLSRVDVAYLQRPVSS